jgi:hypothetical protein
MKSDLLIISNKQLRDRLLSLAIFCRKKNILPLQNYNGEVGKKIDEIMEEAEVITLKRETGYGNEE